jgi:hypothetical protein
MGPHDTLKELRDRYLTAVYSSHRVLAIRQFRTAQPQPPPDPDPAVLLPLLETLLHYSAHDGAAGRFAAARLLRDLWHGLSGEAIDGLFHNFTLRMVRNCPTRGTVERDVIWEAIDGGLVTASPSLVGRWCVEMVASEASRCLGRAVPYCARIGWFSFAFAPAPSFDVLRLVARRAPEGVWPRLARNVWLLYNQDIHLAEGLVAFGAKAPVPTHRCRVELRRSSDGKEEYVESCWDVGQRMLLRTLCEARPADLCDAAPGFFMWLEELGALWEEDLEPLLPLLAGWNVLPVARVLERWTELPTVWQLLKGAPSRNDFRHKAALALSQVRARLGISPEVVPAAAPRGEGSEAAPFLDTGNRGAERLPVVGEPRG